VHQNGAGNSAVSGTTSPRVVIASLGAAGRKKQSPPIEKFRKGKIFNAQPPRASKFGDLLK